MLICLVIALVCLLVTIVALFLFGEKQVRGFFNEKTVRAVVACIAGIVMYYTPDEVDRIILTILAIFEITPISIDLLNNEKTKN